jgi:hypothetical protein
VWSVGLVRNPVRGVRVSLRKGRPFAGKGRPFTEGKPNWGRYGKSADILLRKGRGILDSPPLGVEGRPTCGPRHRYVKGVITAIRGGGTALRGGVLRPLVTEVSEGTFLLRYTALHQGFVPETQKESRPTRKANPGGHKSWERGRSGTNYRPQGCSPNTRGRGQETMCLIGDSRLKIPKPRVPRGKLGPVGGCLNLKFLNPMPWGGSPSPGRPTRRRRRRPGRSSSTRSTNTHSSWLRV